MINEIKKRIELAESDVKFWQRKVDANKSAYNSLQLHRAKHKLINFEYELKNYSEKLDK